VTDQLSPSAVRQAHTLSNSVTGFARCFLDVKLYPYQKEAAEAIVQSVFERDGKTFILIFSRQSGKDEVLAIIFLFLMMRLQDWGLNVVCAQPTFKPQTINAMERLRTRGVICGRHLTRTAGYIMRLVQSRVAYFSAEPIAHQVGATADRLLVMNEAQDIDQGVYDKRFSPMAASGNATRVFSGTSWTSSTLLAREKRAALEAEKLDGVRRVFMVDADQVGQVNPYYKRHVAAEILKLGRNHPFIRTQYFCEEIDAQAGMFNTLRLALMQADQPPQDSPSPFAVLANGEGRGGAIYAFLIDVAGQDEARISGDETAPLTNPGRDSVSLTIASVDLSTLATLQAPTFRFVSRKQWTGINHLTVFGQVKAFGDIWLPQYFVVDATGVGEGFWAMLDKAFPGRVIPVKFSQQSKSELGWRFLAIIETGRLHDCCPTDQVRAQYNACQSEILPGPGKVLRWGVPQGARGADGELIHDDYLLADALIAEIDRLEWAASTDVFVGEGFDPLESIL
jgi:hypothetical protein